LRRDVKIGIIFIAMAFIATINLLSEVRAQNGEATIKSLVKIFATLKSENNSLLDAEQLGQAARFIDYSTMAERAIGEKYWHKLNDQQMKDYLYNFKLLIEQRYYMRWHKIFANSTFVYQNESRNGNDTLVNSLIITGKDKKSILWKLSGQPPKVIDLTVDNRDLLTVMRGRFAKKLAKSDIENFIKWLQKACKLSG